MWRGRVGRAESLDRGIEFGDRGRNECCCSPVIAGSDVGVEAEGDADIGAWISPERFPRLLAASSELMSGDADERFDFGLELLLRGLAALADD